MIILTQFKEKRWRGPGTVLGKEGNFVLIRHGAQYYRCHPCQLMKKNNADESSEVKEMETTDHENSEAKEIDTTERKNTDSNTRKVIYNELDSSSED